MYILTVFIILNPKSGKKKSVNLIWPITHIAIEVFQMIGIKMLWFLNLWRTVKKNQILIAVCFIYRKSYKWGILKFLLIMF